MFTLKLKFGAGQLEYQAADIKAIHRFSAIWGALPQTCQVCQSKNIILSHKNPKGNDYYGIRCLDCGAELNMHQKKEGGGFYITADDKMKVWEKSESNAPQPNVADAVAKVFGGDEVPF